MAASESPSLERAGAALAAGDVVTALSLFEQLTETQPQRCEHWLGLGAALIEHKRHARALTALERARDIAPEHAEVLANLSIAQRNLGLTDAALENARAALLLAPGNALIRLNLGLLLFDRGEREQAVAHFEALTREAPGFAPAHYHLGHALLVLGQTDKAAPSLQRSVQLQPASTPTFLALIEYLFRKRRDEEALRALNARRAKAPFDQYAHALRMIALRNLGWHDAVARLDDADTQLRVYRIAVPAGYDSVAAFNQALTRHIATHPELTEVHGQATKNGFRVENTLEEPIGPIDDLANWILVQLQDYLGWMRDTQHPLAAASHRNLQLKGWGVLMYSGGYETPHLHPDGVLSCVYYASIPPEVKAGAQQEGQICFGQPDPFYTLHFEPKVKAVRPEEGMLLVFPSWMWHHTVPFSSEQRRLSLAFDLRIF